MTLDEVQKEYNNLCGQLGQLELAIGRMAKQKIPVVDRLEQLQSMAAQLKLEEQTKKLQELEAKSEEKTPELDSQ